MKELIKEVLLSTGTGFMVGIIFAKFKLPIPAPTTLTGVMGIVGIFLGYLITTQICKGS